MAKVRSNRTALQLNPPTNTIPRRRALLEMGAILGAALPLRSRAGYRLATFSADVTPPLGHPCMGGGIAPVAAIDDPLAAHGFVLLGPERPVVVVAVDWCEIRNDAYERWRTALAAAAATTPERVLVASVHQHDAPVADLEAERLLERSGAAGRICNLDFHDLAVRNVARALAASLPAATPVTHFGTGKGRVEQVASNRRYVRPDGTLGFNRTSATRDPALRALPEGTVDPWLTTLSFWNGDRPVAALSSYATHPMTHYGKGRVSADFVGLARKRRQADDPGIAQIYASGCSGNVTAGKNNDGSPENRPILADRIYRAMVAAWDVTSRHRLEQLSFRVAPLRLEPRSGPGFTVEDLQKRLTGDPKPFGQCLAALGLSWRKRVAEGHVIDVPMLDLGAAGLVLLPGEAYLEYQLAAQALRPDALILALGYGECAPGYIPIEKAWEENDTNLKDWCWVAPGSETHMRAVLQAVLRPASRR